MRERHAGKDYNGRSLTSDHRQGREREGERERERERERE